MGIVLILTYYLYLYGTYTYILLTYYILHTTSLHHYLYLQYLLLTSFMLFKYLLVGVVLINQNHTHEHSKENEVLKHVYHWVEPHLCLVPDLRWDCIHINSLLTVRTESFLRYHAPPLDTALMEGMPTDKSVDCLTVVEYFSTDHTQGIIIASSRHTLFAVEARVGGHSLTEEQDDLPTEKPEVEKEDKKQEEEYYTIY